MTKGTLQRVPLSYFLHLFLKLYWHPRLARRLPYDQSGFVFHPGDARHGISLGILMVPAVDQINRILAFLHRCVLHCGQRYLGHGGKNRIIKACHRVIPGHPVPSLTEGCQYTISSHIVMTDKGSDGKIRIQSFFTHFISHFILC